MERMKKKMLFLIIIVIVGIISGIIFSNILSKNDEEIVVLKITDYFNNIKNDTPIDYMYNLISSLKNNIIYLVIIWLLGLSIIGLVINNFILFFKNFILGFTMGCIIKIYLFKGIVLSIIYIFPSLIINILIIIMMVYYANHLSLNLFDFLFLKKDIKFHYIIKRYIKILLISSIILVISSFLETFLTPFILKLFSFLIN